MNKLDIIKLSIEEDLGQGDVTTDPIFTTEVTSAKLVAKEAGIIAGVDVFKQVFAVVDESVKVDFTVNDGAVVTVGQVIASIEGLTKSILHAERVALNLIQRMSGVATLTSKYVAEVKNDKTKIYDTRKTTPMLRPFEKEAVVIGGGANHRYNLGDQVLIKDNHIAAAGSITKAVELTNNANPEIYIEVECENLQQVKECLDTKLVDIIMLDNMSNQMMAEAVALIDGECIVEASGNMTIARIGEVSELGVDRISVGNLTHSYTSLDISLKMEDNYAN